MTDVTDPQEIERGRRRWAQFDRNSAWLQEHLEEVYRPENRGKYVCIAGQTAYVADTVEEALAKGTDAHPDDEGRFFRYIPLRSAS